jgi:hypothetical protein
LFFEHIGAVIWKGERELQRACSIFHDLSIVFRLASVTWTVPTLNQNDPISMARRICSTPQTRHSGRIGANRRRGDQKKPRLLEWLHQPHWRERKDQRRPSPRHTPIKSPPSGRARFRHVLRDQIEPVEKAHWQHPVVKSLMASALIAQEQGPVTVSVSPSDIDSPDRQFLLG